MRGGRGAGPRMVRLLASLILLLLHPHNAPTLWVDATVEPTHVELLVCVRADHAGVWLEGGLPPEDLIDDITEDERRAAEGALTDYFARHNLVRIDGERVAPLARGVGVPEDDQGREMIGFVAFRLVYRCDGWPQRLQIEWEDFEAANFQGEPVIPGTLRVGPQWETMAFSPEGPKFAWAYPESGLPEKPPIESLPAPPSLLWIAHALVGLAALGGAAGLLRASAGPAAWILLAALVGGSALALPWEPAASPVITRPQARRVFEQLLTNVYRAFEAVTEEDGYDLLAYSVEPDLAQELYLDVREGLEMREQGGAIAEVGHVERRGGSVTFTGARAFDAEWRWRVYAHVTHWGHTHSRINEYRARFRVRAGDRGWRIAEFDLLDMERIPTEDDQ